MIQLALNQNISTVCIDEAVGRRIARLNGLCLTGSVGVLLRAKSKLSGYSAHADQKTLCDWVTSMPEPPGEIQLKTIQAMGKIDIQRFKC